VIGCILLYFEGLPEKEIFLASKKIGVARMSIVEMVSFGE